MSLPSPVRLMLWLCALLLCLTLCHTHFITAVSAIRITCEPGLFWRICPTSASQCCSGPQGIAAACCPESTLCAMDRGVCLNLQQRNGHTLNRSSPVQTPSLMQYPSPLGGVTFSLGIAMGIMVALLVVLALGMFGGAHVMLWSWEKLQRFITRQRMILAQRRRRQAQLRRRRAREQRRQQREAQQRLRRAAAASEHGVASPEPDTALGTSGTDAVDHNASHRHIRHDDPHTLTATAAPPPDDVTTPLLQAHASRRPPPPSQGRHTATHTAAAPTPVTTALHTPPTPIRVQTTPTGPSSTEPHDHHHTNADHLCDNNSSEPHSSDDEVEDELDAALHNAEHLLCNICLARRSVALMIPCGHVCTCRKCSARLKVCPLCREDVLRMILLERSVVRSLGTVSNATATPTATATATATATPTATATGTPLRSHHDNHTTVPDRTDNMEQEEEEDNEVDVRVDRESTHTRTHTHTHTGTHPQEKSPTASPSLAHPAARHGHHEARAITTPVPAPDHSLPPHHPSAAPLPDVVAEGSEEEQERDGARSPTAT